MTLDHPPDHRHLPFERAFNFRDLGGYPAAGGPVRWRTVFRADSLHRLTPEELGALGIRTVVDLRTSDELERRGRVDVEGIAYHHLSMLREVWDRQEMEAAAADPAAYLAARYLAMLDEGSEAIAATLGLLADPANLPLVFHCAAGKDRTGVLAAIVLEVVGVGDESIIHDYGLTSLGIERFEAWLRESEPDRQNTMVEQPSGVLAAPEAAMRAFLTEAHRRHGSFAALARTLGVGEETLEAVRANLVDPAR
jgi:protein-tyrosine phosphatase